MKKLWFDLQRVIKCEYRELCDCPMCGYYHCGHEDAESPMCEESGCPLKIRKIENANES